MNARLNSSPGMDCLPNPSLDDLRGRQSVRATFRLSETCIEAISILSAHLGIKQKSLFDHLMEDEQALSAIAQEIDKTGGHNGSRVQKTFVISRKSLRCLDEISKRFHTSRDELVEFSIQRLLPIIARERSKQEVREELFARLQKHFRQAPRLLADIRRELGRDDLMYKKMEAAVGAYRNAIETIAAFIEKTRKIEHFPVENLNGHDKMDL